MRCMTSRSRRLVHWTILITTALTVLGVAIAMNFVTPEKKLERKIEHRYAIADPQFRREMSVLLGPSIVAGNQVRDLQNGNEIFPAMLAAIRTAQKTIDSWHDRKRVLDHGKNPDGRLLYLMSDLIALAAHGGRMSA